MRSSLIASWSRSSWSARPCSAREADPAPRSGGGLILAGILLHSWARKPPRDRIAKSLASPLVDLPPAHHREVSSRWDGRSLNPQQPTTAFETHNGRSALAAGTALHAPEPPLPPGPSNAKSRVEMIARVRKPEHGNLLGQLRRHRSTAFCVAADGED
jgi:hypothetical protein